MIPCYLAIFAARTRECLWSARPGTGYEVGREKPWAFQCRSKLSNLSNHN